MNFPRHIYEIDEFLHYIRHLPLEEQFDLINRAIKELNHQADVSQTGAFSFMQFSNGPQKVTEELLRKYLELNSRGNQDESIHILQQRLESVLTENKALQLIVSSGIKSYKGLFIFLLAHPKSGSTTGAEILSRINYLDKMTRDVTFTMPGYDRAKESEEIINKSDNNLQLTFDENAFVDMIQKLEDQSNGKFEYRDECELVFIGLKPDGSFDFDNFQRLNLDLLSKKRGIDPIKLIITVSQRFRANGENTIALNKFISQILGELALQEEVVTKRVFIAGAKRLQEERALLREELNKIENSQNIDIRSLTFEDFTTSLTGRERGRQADYNKFIADEADVAIFIFDTTAGEITEEEFDVAYSSLVENKHPEIFVYVRKRNAILDMLCLDKRLRKIKKKVFGYNQEYYIEYSNLDNLRYLFHRDMIKYFRTSK